MNSAAASRAQQSADAILPATTRIGTVTLRVSDADQSLRWYREMMGLRLIDRSGRHLVLGAGDRAFLVLDVQPGATPRRDQTTGLYHVAILVPDRPALGGVLARIARAGVRLGASDHLVSEALYIWDPDNNGLEIYRDRPAEQWTWDGGQVRMATDPLDLRTLASEGLAAGTDRTLMPAGTRIGHVHLQVGDLAVAKRFYCDILGFEQTSARHGALFVSAGRYHHHLGMNIWHSRNAPPPAPDAAGLVEYEIVLPDGAALNAARARLEAAGHSVTADGGSLVVRDPGQIRFRLVTAAER